MAAKKKTTGISPRDLVPDLDNYRSASFREYYYWVGVLPGCPVEAIKCSGMTFPKVQERLIDGPPGSSKKQRVPVIGGMAKMSEDKIRLVRERLPRLVVRFKSGPVQDETGTGKNLGAPHDQRRGYLVRIPSDEDVAMAHKRGRATPRYTQQVNDEPAANYMFAVLCEDQRNPTHGQVYPEPLSVTGLPWPEDQPTATAG